MSRLSSVLLCAAVALSMMSATALARPDSRTMSCEQARRLIAQHGAVVLTTGRYTYDRYVWTDAQCPSGQIAMSVPVPTSDNRNCMLRHCEYVDPDDFIWRFPRR